MMSIHARGSPQSARGSVVAQVLGRNSDGRILRRRWIGREKEAGWVGEREAEGRGDEGGGKKEEGDR